MPEPESEVPQFETFAMVQEEDELIHAPVTVEDEFETNAHSDSTFSDPTASFADLNEEETAFSTAAKIFRKSTSTSLRPPTRRRQVPKRARLKKAGLKT